MPDEKVQLHISRPTDRTLESFKKWIQGVVERINPGATDGKLTEEAWIKNHKEFWDKVDSASKK